MPRPSDKQQQALDVVGGGLDQLITTIRKYVPDCDARLDAINAIYLVGFDLERAICPEGRDFEPRDMRSPEYGNNYSRELERGEKV